MVFLQDLEAGSIYGLEKLWAFFHYGSVIPQDSAVKLNPKVCLPASFNVWHITMLC